MIKIRSSDKQILHYLILNKKGHSYEMSKQLPFSQKTMSIELNRLMNEGLLDREIVGGLTGSIKKNYSLTDYGVDVTTASVR